MTTEITHITQLNRQDIKDIRAATNPTQGLGIRIERRGDSFVFSLDESTVRTMIYAFLRNGGSAATAPANLDGISLTNWS